MPRTALMACRNTLNQIEQRYIKFIQIKMVAIKSIMNSKLVPKCQIPDGRRILNNTQLLIVGVASCFICHSVKRPRGDFIRNYRFEFMLDRDEKLYCFS